MRIGASTAVAPLAALVLAGCVTISAPVTDPSEKEIAGQTTTSTTPPPETDGDGALTEVESQDEEGSDGEGQDEEGQDAEGQDDEDYAVAGWEDVVATTRSGIVGLTVVGCDPTVYGTGSGFLLAPDLVVTAAHVVDGAVTTSVTVDGQLRDAVALGIDRGADLALLSLDEPVDGYTFSWPEDEVGLGSDVAALGFPLSRGFSITDGTLSSYEREHGREWVRFSAPVNPGNSGGAVVDRDGQVVGIVSYRIDQDDGRQVDGFGYALSHVTARPLIEGWLADPEPPSAPECDTGTAPFDLTVDTDVSDPAVAAAALTVLAHGEAINNGTYESAYALFTPQMQAAMGSLEQWSSGLTTSFWTEVTLTDSRVLEDGIELRVTLRTQQSAEDGPDGATCSDWDLWYVLLWDDDAQGYYIDQVRQESEPTACGE